MVGGGPNGRDAAPGGPGRLAPARAAWWGGRSGELALALAVLLVAGLVRWPYLQQIPRFTDEVVLWRLAVDVAESGARPLVFEDTGYNGALLIYLLAAVRAVSGAVAVPRLLALGIGSATVLAVYVLGRGLHGRAAGALAAAFFAVSLTPVLVYSHVLHMTSLAVLLQVLGWCAAVRAVQRGSGAWLVVAGAVTGLAVQTHPLSAAFVPGLALWMWRQPGGRGLLWSRWGALAAVAGVVAYGPILAYHLPSLLDRAEARLTGVAEGMAEHWQVVPYPRGMANWVVAMVAAIGSAGSDAASAWWTDALALLLAGVVVLSLLAAARHGQSLPFWLMTSAWVCMPLVMREYNTTLPGRYTGLALPAVALALGLTAALALQPSGEATVRRLAPRRLAAALIVGVVLVALTVRLVDHYRREVVSQHTNAALMAVAVAIEQEPLPVVLDGQIRRTNGRGTGPSGVLHGILAWRGVELKKWSKVEKLDQYLAAVTWPAHVIVADATYHQLLTRDRLRPVPGGHVAPVSDVDGWGLYRLAPPSTGD